MGPDSTVDAVLAGQPDLGVEPEIVESAFGDEVAGVRHLQRAVDDPVVGRSSALDLLIGGYPHIAILHPLGRVFAIKQDDGILRRPRARWRALRCKTPPLAD